ncbi:MAG: diguanylate cyclase [Desulfobacterales bacterium]|nr:diguanylate cyclase [Desulfobacterales bacterium]
MFGSLTTEKFRRLFLTFVMLSCLLPVLIMIFIIYHYTVPVLEPYQMDELRGIFNLGIVCMLLVQGLGSLLLLIWINSFENLTREMEQLSSGHLQTTTDSVEESGNELTKLNTIFNRLTEELQTKIQQVNAHATEMQKVTAQVNTIACTDDLTGLFNRRHFKQKLTEASRRADKLDHSVWLMRFEIDDFRKLNEKHADLLLEEIGKLARQNLTKKALPFRIGRNDFAIILSDCDGKTTARTASRLSTAVNSHEFKDSRGLSLGNIAMSCGIANYRNNMQTLFSDAGKALVTAQKTGKQIAIASTI